MYKEDTFSDLILIMNFFVKGLQVPCRNAFGIDFTALTPLWFSVALCMYILTL